MFNHLELVFDIIIIIIIIEYSSRMPNSFFFFKSVEHSGITFLIKYLLQDTLFKKKKHLEKFKKKKSLFQITKHSLWINFELTQY